MTALNATPAPGRGTALLLAGLGAGLVGLAVWGLVRDVVWISQPFYAYAWWGWILLLDGFCVWRRGSSLLTTRRGLLPLLATSSVTFWVFFELLNIRFKNWYYIGTFELSSPGVYVGAAVFVFAAFATVFIGMFEAFDALGAAKVLTKRKAPRALPAWVPRGLQLLGLTMAVLAIAFPFYLAPLIWGSFTFLLDPWNYKKGNRSLLRDIEAGDGQAVWRLFLAGLISGLVWESLNFAAPQKWVYTVRGLEGFKLFEMPLLGFLGFPALAFDAVTAFSLLSYFLCGNLVWEHPDDLAAPPGETQEVSLSRYYWTLPLQAAFCVVVTYGVIRTNIGSVRLQLARVPLAAQVESALQGVDVTWPRHLVAALEDPERRAGVLAATGWSDAEADAARDQAELYLFKGIGSWNGSLLEALGIRRVSDLGDEDPVALHAALTQRAEEVDLWVPNPDWVRVWVLASRSRGVLMRAGD